MNKLQSVCLTGLVVAGVVVGTSMANAAPVPSPLPPPIGQAFTADVLTDVKTQHADVFSDASLDENDVLTIETTKTFKADAKLAAKLAKADSKVKLKVVKGPTDKTKRDAIAEVASVFFAQPSVDSGITTYDEPTERVVANYTPKKGATVTPGPSEALGIPVVYQLSQVEPPQPHVISGGTQLTYSGTSTLACTGGFTGTRGTTFGLITANHCPNNLGYESRGILQLGATANRSRGDAQFMTVATSLAPNESIWNRYIADAPNYQPVLRELRRASFTTKGYDVCTFGQATIRTQCAKVIDVRATIAYRNVPGFEPGTYENLVITGTTSTGGPATQPGDSGGPWWLLSDSTNGVGITSGGGGYNANGVYCSKNCSYYSDLISVSSDMGVTLKIN